MTRHLAQSAQSAQRRLRAPAPVEREFATLRKAAAAGHGRAFTAYWRWKSRPRGGRPKVSAEIRRLIRAMSLANPLWGAPRIHGELLKLGIDVGQTSVAEYMARYRRPPSQSGRRS